ncbi:MAG: hypothetical protein ACRBDL_05995 [Alphaproteobacteria bacterium]
MNDDDDNRKAKAKKLFDTIEKIQEQLIADGVDLEELRQNALEELDIVRAEKAAKNATIH